MITFETAVKIREAYCANGGNKSKVARDCHVSRDTVRAVLARDYSAPRDTARPRNAGYDAEIERLLRENQKDLRAFAKNRLTAKRIHELLKQSQNCPLCLRTIQRTVKRLRCAVRAEADAVALCLNAPPGHAQVDFGEVCADINGKRERLNLLICSFPHSNAASAVVMPSQSAASLFEGLGLIFASIGGVPPVMRFDNLAPAVAKICGRERILTKAFERFVLHYGFKPEFCNPARGNEKGNVESKVKYIRQNFFVPIPAFASVDALNASLDNWCVSDQKRRHYRQNVKISTLFSDDLAALQPLPEKRFVFFETLIAKTDKRGFVRFAQNDYFAGMPRRLVHVRATCRHVEIFDESLKLITTHKRVYCVNARVQSAMELARLAAVKLSALPYLVDGRADVAAACERLRGKRMAEREQIILDFLTAPHFQNINPKNKSVCSDLRPAAPPAFVKYDNLVGCIHGVQKGNSKPLPKFEAGNGNSGNDG